MKIAIIYYCYNRLEHTKASYSKLITYKKDLPLFVFCDGAKSEDSNLLKVRDYITEASAEAGNIEIIYRKENLGLAASVIDGVNFVFKKKYDAVIVLEDDCITHESFFDYMIATLSYYDKKEKVMHVSGFGLPMKYNFKKDNYFTPYPCSWGWGTWKNRWETCNFNDNDYYNQILKTPVLKSQFDFYGKSFSHFLKLQLNKEIDSWLIRWYVHIFKNQGLSSWSSTTHITNIGFDGTGVHKVNYDRFNQYKNIKKENYSFEDNSDTVLPIVREFRQHFMGPKIIDKIKTMIYLKTGIILERMPGK